MEISSQCAWGMFCDNPENCHDEKGRVVELQKPYTAVCHSSLTVVYTCLDRAQYAEHVHLHSSSALLHPIPSP